MTCASWMKAAVLFTAVGLVLWSAGLYMQEQAASINYSIVFLGVE